jgi:hypothetical protein
MKTAAGPGIRFLPIALAILFLGRAASAQTLQVQSFPLGGSPHWILPGEGEEDVLFLELSASGATIRFAGLAVSAQGTLDAPAHVQSVSLYWLTGAVGSPPLSQRTLLASAVFPAGGGKAVLNGFGISVYTANPEYFMVTCAVVPDAPPGDTVRLGVVAPADASATYGSG